MKWPRKPLSRVADIVRGVSFDRSDVQKEPRQKYVPILRAGNISQILLTEEDLVWVPRKLVSESQMLQEGDIAIAMSSGSANIVGKTAQLRDRWNGSVGAFCAIIRPRLGINERFLAYWLEGEEFALWRRSQCLGVNINNLRKQELAAIQIPLPPLSEQRKIVELLDQADALRKRRAAADKKAERILPALFYKMFGDPATNPMGWEMTSIGDITESTRNGLYKHADYYGRGTQILKMFNINNGELHLDRIDLVDVTIDEKDKYSLLPGDILINRVNTRELVGKCAVITNVLGEAVFESKNIRLRVNNGRVTPNYVAFFLNTEWGHSRLCQGVKHAIGMATINNTDLAKTGIPVPPLSLQDQWSRVVENVRSLSSSTDQTGEKITNLFTTMLHRAFAGELTAKWREAHMKELLEEMEIQARELGLEAVSS
jgi:type I restriction enzyme S subunit